MPRNIAAYVVMIGSLAPGPSVVVMATYGLVHGAWHGAWCWDELREELEERGHATVAVDLPCDDWDAGLSDNADIVVDALGDADDVVLVGHSLGGITIPVVAKRRAVQRMVFLCALLPKPGQTMDEVLGGDAAVLSPEFGKFIQVVNEDNSVSWDPASAVEAFYHDCPPDLAKWAASKLRRQVWATTQERSPLDAWPDVPSTYIVCSEDRTVSPEWSRRAAKEWIGADLIELPGGHSPFLSRPAELADVLVSLP
jgi:pimeloyl-ACP methyl ester carboxylesterase